jgi:hypothetical protein
MRSGRAIRSRAAGACLLLVLGSACASSRAAEPVEIEWEPVVSPSYVSEDGDFSLRLPVGWLRSGGVLARDPEGLHAISFNAGPVLNDEEARSIDASAPELVQAVHDQLAAQPGVEVLDCRAATLDGIPGFRAHFVQEDAPEGARSPAKREHLLYSAIDGEMLYAFALETPAGADFARDLPEFEELVASFRRLDPAR